MRSYIPIITFFILITTICGKGEIHYQHKTKPAKDASWAIKQIAALPEVKAFMRHAKKKNPCLQFNGIPDSASGYFWIKEGISNFDMFRTSTDYYIDPKTDQIYIADPMNEGPHAPNLVKLKVARLWGGTKYWAKPHIFKGDKLIVVNKI